MAHLYLLATAGGRQPLVKPDSRSAVAVGCPLAAGFTTADTAYVLAALIRSVFFQPGKGITHVDGRTKDSWVAQTFGLSLRAVRTARKHLGKIGWLEEQPTHQNLRNLYGTHVIVNVDWSPNEQRDHGSHDVHGDHASEAGAEVVDNSSVGEGRGSAGSATPQAEIRAGFATPRNRKALPTGDSKTRRLRADAPSPSGVCTASRRRKAGTPKRTRTPSSTPNIRDVQPEHLKDPEALQELRTQALALGFAFHGSAGELDFFALANRALTRGQRPGALFFDLISKRRTAFITIADEEAARRQLRELRDGPDLPRDGGGERAFKARQMDPMPDYSEDEQLVLKVEKSCPGRKPEELFRAARNHLPDGWTLDRWLTAHLSLRVKDARRWALADEEDYSIGSLINTRAAT